MKKCKPVVKQVASSGWTIMKPNYIIEVSKKRKQWYWVIKAANRQILATSETYSSMTKAEKTAYKLLESFKDGEVVILTEIKVKV